MLAYFQIPSGEDDPESVSRKRAAAEKAENDEHVKMGGATPTAVKVAAPKKPAAKPKEDKKPEPAKPTPAKVGLKPLNKAISDFIILNIEAGKLKNEMEEINKVLSGNGFEQLNEKRYEKLQESLSK